MLSKREKAFVYAAGVLAQLEAAGALRISLRIYTDTSCSLIMQNGTDPNLLQLASTLLFSENWEQTDIFYLRLDSKDGLMYGADVMEKDNA